MDEGQLVESGVFSDPAPPRTLRAIPGLLETWVRTDVGNETSHPSARSVDQRRVSRGRGAFGKIRSPKLEARLQQLQPSREHLLCCVEDYYG